MEWGFFSSEKQFDVEFNGLTCPAVLRYSIYSVSAYVLRWEYRSHLMCMSGVEDLHWACVIHTRSRMMGFIFQDWHDSDWLTDWLSVCLFASKNAFVWVCGVFWEVASHHLTITVHLEEKIRFCWVLMNANKTVYVKCFNLLLVVAPRWEQYYHWWPYHIPENMNEMQETLFFFNGTVFFLLFDSIFNFATCTWMHLQVNTDMFWAVVSEFKAPVSSFDVMHQRMISEYLSLMLYILRMNFCTPVSTDLFVRF